MWGATKHNPWQGLKLAKTQSRNRASCSSITIGYCGGIHVMLVIH
jgi:hypothetical protein